MVEQGRSTKRTVIRLVFQYWPPLGRSLAAAVALAAMIAALTVMTAAKPMDLRHISFADIPHWQADDHGQALKAFQRSCGNILRPGAGFARKPAFGGNHGDWRDVCRQAEKLEPSRARWFFETGFVPVVVADPERPQGLFTGYFEPEVDGSRTRGGPFQVPLYRRPGDLEAFDAEARRVSGVSYGRRVAGMPLPYFTRKEIETGALAGQDLELVWLSDWADAFFLQGVICLRAGRKKAK